MTKLIEVLGAGFGTLYRPRAIRNEAEAKAYATRIQGDAELQNEQTRLSALALTQAASATELIKADEKLESRIDARLRHRETQRQLNLETIAEAAVKHLPDEVTEAAVDEDWKTRFFNIAEDVSSSDMQELWGKILAGEVASPGSFSVRTLETLRNLSKQEAEAFRRLRYLCFDGGVLKSNGDDLLEFGISFQDILDLRAAGLVADGDTLSITYPITRGRDWFGIRYNGSIIRVDPLDKTAEKISFPNFALTSVGKELLSLIEPEPNIPYLKKLAQIYKPQCILYLGADMQSTFEKL